MEKIEAVVDFKTAEAVRGLQGLNDALQTSEKMLGGAKQGAEGTDKALEDVAKSSQDAGKGLTETAKGAEKTEKALKETAGAAEKAGNELAEAGRKGKKGMKDAGDESDRLAAATNKLAAGAKSMAMSYLSFQMALEILKEMEKRTLAVIEARQKLAGYRLDTAEQVAPLVDNLGLFPDAKGQQAAMDVAMELRRRTGAKTGQAVDILSQFQATGISVFDADKFRKTGDAKGAINEDGMKMAEMVGVFAARTSMDAETAGKLPLIAKQLGVDSPEKMTKMLASLEAAAQRAPLTQQKDYIKNAIRAIMPGLAAGGPLEKELADFGAFVGVSSSAEGAATSALAFGRAASGDEDTKATALAERALKAGLISEQDVADAGTGARNKAMAEAQPRINKIDREIKDKKDADARLLMKEEEKIRREQEDIELAERSLRKIKDPLQRKKAETEIKRRRDDLATEKTDLLDARRERNQQIDDLSRQREEIITDADKKGRDAGLVIAYRSKLTGEQKKDFLRETLAGMTDREKAAFLPTVAPGEDVQRITAATTKASLTSREETYQAAKNASLEDFGKRQQSFGATNTLATAGQLAVASDAEKSRASAPGAEFALGLATQAKEQVDIESAKGNAPSWLNGFLTDGSPSSEVEAKVFALRRLVAKNYAALWNQMTPAQRSKYGSRFEEIKHGLTNVYGFNENRYKQLYELAEKLGALRTEIRSEAAAEGRSLPGEITEDISGKIEDPHSWKVRGFEGAVVPFGEGVIPAKPENIQPMDGVPSSSPPVPLVPAEAGASPKTREVSVINQTIHIGNHFARELDDDLPGREILPAFDPRSA